MRIYQEAIDNLLKQKPTAPAVTIYAPTHRFATPPHMTEDQIRFKNLVHRAVEIVKTRDDGREIERLLDERLGELLGDQTFWEQRTESLLLCCRPGTFEIFELPIDTEEYVAVDTHFHLAPVFALLDDAREYYVLLVAQHDPALLEGDMYGLYPTKNLRLPSTLEEGLNIDEMKLKSEQQRSTGGETGGFNGRGGAKNPAEEERQRFWRMIDQKILAKANSKLPLILAGVESEVVEYKEQSHYPKLLHGSIHGSFSGANPHDLFGSAWRIIQEELIKPTHHEAIERYERLRGENPNRVAGDLAAITNAADAGRVDTLLLNMARYTTDTVRDNAEPVTRLTFPGPEPSKVANDLAEMSWLRSGHVINIEDSNMPEKGAAMLALLRY